MNTTQKFIGLLAILPFALVALTPDLIGEAYANDGSAFEDRYDSSSNAGIENTSGEHNRDAFVEKWGSTSNAGIEEKYPDTHDGSAFEKRLASLGN